MLAYSTFHVHLKIQIIDTLRTVKIGTQTCRGVGVGVKLRPALFIWIFRPSQGSGLVHVPQLGAYMDF